ncbi:hypothetical protein GB937_000887 [Aspergillus fischeri]|nr:hypothetical protein GB937_000887 [Aspergillus fischeri]
MDITTILNRKGSTAAIAAEAQFQQQFVHHNLDPSSSPKMKPEPGVSEASDQQVLSYPSHAPLNPMPNMAQDMRYPPHGQPNSGMPVLQNPYVPGAYTGSAQIPSSATPQRADPPPKTFHCSTCGKGFARRSDLARHERARAPGDGVFSEHASVHSTPSPAHHPVSIPPPGDLPPLNMPRSAGDYYMGNGSIPPHVRGDFSQASPRSSPTATSPSLSSFSSAPHQRPSMTSHPSGYAPPQPLEPPANSDHRPNSVSGSPHMTSLGWASPSHGSIPSPGSVNDFNYPEPSGPAYPSSMPPHMYFPNSTIRRPTSTEPENYELKPRLGDNGWSTPV